MSPLDLALNVADSRNQSTGKRVRLSHPRRRRGNPLGSAVVEGWALDSTISLKRCHHSGVVRRAVDVWHVEIRRVRSLRPKLLRIMKLLLSLLWLLSRLQDTLLLLKTIRLPDDSCVIRRSLHRQSGSTTGSLLHPRLGHHLHRHRIRRHRAIDGCATRHSLHGTIWVNTNASRHAIRYPIRCAIWHSRCAVRHTVWVPSGLAVYHWLLVGHLTPTLSSQIRLFPVSGHTAVLEQMNTYPLLRNHLLPVLFLPLLQLHFPLVLQPTELSRRRDRGLRLIGLVDFSHRSQVRS